MKFLYYLIALPFLVAAAWAIYAAESSAEGISFSPWPQDCLNLNLVLAIFLLSGYIFGRLSSWFMYYPLRRELRRQKKSNKTLNQEQEKLHKTVDNLKQDIIGLQEKAKQDIVAPAEKKLGFFKSWMLKSKQSSQAVKDVEK